MSTSSFPGLWIPLAILAVACGEPKRPTQSNRAPSLELGEPLELREGEVRTVRIATSDPDGDAVTVTLEDAPSWATLEGGALHLAPQFGQAGAFTLRATASDGALTATDTLVVTVHTSLNGKLVLNDGHPFTRHPQVKVQLEVLPGSGASTVVDVAFSRDGQTFDAPQAFAEVFDDVALDASGDGLKKLWARVRDDAGTVGVLSAEVTLDRTAPTVVAIAPRAVRSTGIALDVSVEDAGPVEQVCFSNDGVVFGGCTAPAAAMPWTILPGEGAKTVTVRAVDAAGNEGFAEVQLHLDTTPPSGAIALGVTVTRAREIPLTLSVTDAPDGPARMAFSFDDGATWSDEVPFAAATTVVLPDCDGAHALMVKVIDLAGNAATFGPQTVTLDRVAPTGALRISDVHGSGYVGRPTVQLAINFSDSVSGVVSMAFANDEGPVGAAEAVSPTRTWTLSGGDGPKVVRMRLADAAGNTVDLQTSVTLDTTPPTATLQIQGGALWTVARDVTVMISVGPGGGATAEAICITNDTGHPASNDGCWRPLGAAFAHTLSAGDGSKTVYLYVRDVVGNVRKTSATITLDTTAPIPVIQDVRSQSRTAHVSWDAVGDPTGITGYEICTRMDPSDPYDCASIGLALSHTLTSLPNGQAAIIAVAATDGAGHRGMSNAVSSGTDFPFRETQRLPTAGTLRDAHLLSADEQVAVGEQGLVFRTTDRWASFDRVDPMVDTDLHAIAGNGDVLHAVGANGTIVTSRDRGRTWRRSAGVTNTLNAVTVAGVSMIRPTLKWIAVGEDGTIATIRLPRNLPACGLSCPEDVWAVQQLPNVGALRAVTYSEDSLVAVAVGDGGKIVRSFDEGANWSSVTSPVTTSLLAVAAVPGGNTFFAATSGAILKSTDAGNSWAAVTTSGAALGPIVAIEVTSDGHLYVAHGVTGSSDLARLSELKIATNVVRTVWTWPGSSKGLGGNGQPGRVTHVGSRGLIVATLDANAATPQSRTPTKGTTNAFRGLMPSPSADIVWAVGESGQTAYDLDDGGTWILKSGPSTSNRRSVAVLPTGEAFAVGNAGSVWRNPQPSAAWTEVGVSGSNLRSVACVGSTPCYAVGSSGGILKFNGTSWSIDFYAAGSSESFMDVALYRDGGSRVRGIAIKSDGTFHTNLDEIWTARLTVIGPAGANPTPVPIAVAARPTGVAIVVGERGGMYRSTNHGLDWTPLTNVVGTRTLHDVLWARDDLWFASGDAGLLLRSDDNGLNWTVLETNSTRALHSLGHHAYRLGSETFDTVWAAGQDGTILRSRTGGL